MTNTRIFLGVALTSALILTGSSVSAQTATVTTPHLVVIKLIEQPGNKIPFAFEPAAFTAERGDTLEFVQFASVMHDVHFKNMPKGAKLGSAAISPYLIAKGDNYRIVVDSRFVAGSYELVCDPHEMVGMHAMLTVGRTIAAR